MLKHFLSPPNWFTSASIFCGFYAILLAAGNAGDAAKFYQAGLLIGFAGVFDMLDGRVARMTHRESEFGTQLDSLADVVSFGLAPAMLVYSWGLSELGGLGLAAAFFFVLCGIFRLARFNVGAADGEETERSKGLTITMAGGTLAAMVMFHAAIGRTFVSNPWPALAITGALALLMVSDVPFRGIKSLRLKRTTKIFAALFMGALIVVGVRYDISYMVLPFMATYVVSGPIEGIISGDWRRRGRDAVVQLDDDDEL